MIFGQSSEQNKKKVKGGLLGCIRALVLFGFPLGGGVVGVHVSHKEPLPCLQISLFLLSEHVSQNSEELAEVRHAPACPAQSYI